MPVSACCFFTHACLHAAHVNCQFRFPRAVKEVFCLHLVCIGVKAWELKVGQKNWALMSSLTFGTMTWMKINDCQAFGISVHNGGHSTSNLTGQTVLCQRVKGNLS